MNDLKFFESMQNPIECVWENNLNACKFLLECLISVQIDIFFQRQWTILHFV